MNPLEKFLEYSKSNKTAEAEDYIRSRQFKLDDFEWGYFPKNEASDELIRQYPEEYKKLKIAYIGYSGEVNSLFSDRLIFPIRDISGKLIAVSGRAINEGAPPPKYYNSGYLKGYNLYYLNEAIPYIRKENYVLVCEGYFASLRLHSCNIKNVVSTCGTLFTRGQLDALSRYTTNIGFLRDNDEAGSKSTKETLEKYSKLEHINLFEIKLEDIDNKEDPDDYILKHGKDKLLDLINRQKVLK
jgi:DNA primase